MRERLIADILLDIEGHKQMVEFWNKMLHSGKFPKAMCEYAIMSHERQVKQFEEERKVYIEQLKNNYYD